MEFESRNRRDQKVLRKTQLSQSPTDRDKERDLHESLKTCTEYAQSILDASVDMIISVDMDRNIVEFNHAAEETFGYAKAEVIGKNVEILYAESTEGTRVNSVVASDGRFRGEIMSRRKDGTVFPSFLSSSALPDRSGKRVGFMGISRDITEIKRNEELLQQSRDELETRVLERTESLRSANERLNKEIQEHKRTQYQLSQAQKMEVVGQLAGGVAHDFNNVLSAVLCYTDLVSHKLGPDSPVEGELSQVSLAAEKAAALTRQLLAFSRRQILQPKDLDLNDLISNLLKMVHRVIGEHIELDFAPGRDLSSVHVDAGQVEQVLLNLCINARDAMPEGGKLRITTENATAAADLRADHPWATSDRYVLLKVIDTGCGMTSEVLDQIFEPFFTTKEVGKGTGLGLATAYGIVNQHKGIILAHSEVDKGTTFELYWPSVDRKSVRIAKSTKESEVVGGTETVLVVEDDTMVRTLSTYVLEHAGYAVLTAADGKEALHTFEKHREEIDLVFLDVIMPRMGGREVYDEIQKLDPRTRVLFTSGYNESEIHNQFILNEGLRLIPKPFSRDGLLQKVREVLDEKVD